MCLLFHRPLLSPSLSQEHSFHCLFSNIKISESEQLKKCICYLTTSCRSRVKTGRSWVLCISFLAMAKALTIVIVIWLFTGNLFPCSSSWQWSSRLYGCVKSWVMELGSNCTSMWAVSTWAIKLLGGPLSGIAPSLFGEAFTRSNTAKDNTPLDYLQINHLLSLPHPFTIIIICWLETCHHPAHNSRSVCLRGYETGGGNHEGPWNVCHRDLQLSIKPGRFSILWTLFWSFSPANAQASVVLAPSFSKLTQ